MRHSGNAPAPPGVFGKSQQKTTTDNVALADMAVSVHRCCQAHATARRCEMETIRARWKWMVRSFVNSVSDCVRPGAGATPPGKVSLMISHRGWERCVCVCFPLSVSAVVLREVYVWMCLFVLQLG